MSWPFINDRDLATELLGYRTSARSKMGPRKVSRKDALRLSVVWACLRLRADLISTMPVDVYRLDRDGVRLKQTTPPILDTPGGPDVGIEEWLYSSNVDLDSTGNAVGIITAVDGALRPARIELQPIDSVTFQMRGGELTYKIGNKVYDRTQIWHERQFTTSGSPIGLSPIAYAAMAINNHLSSQEFAAAWFDNSAIPGGILKNTGKTLKRGEARRAKASFQASVKQGEVWVTGSDWDYSPMSAKANDSAFLTQQDASNHDLARYLGVPADIIDLMVSGSAVTYASISQRNLQLLIINLGPAIIRREKTFSRRLVAGPRFVKLNSGALMRMDPKARADMTKIQVDSRTLAPSEARALDDRAPFTPEQVAEFAELFPGKTPAPTLPGGPS